MPARQICRAISMSSARGPSPAPGTSRMADSPGGRDDPAGRRELRTRRCRHRCPRGGPGWRRRPPSNRQVETAEPVEADSGFDVPHQGIRVDNGAEGQPRGPQMLRVQAHPEALVMASGLEDPGQLFESPTDRAPCPRGVLEEDRAGGVDSRATLVACASATVQDCSRP